MDFLRNNFLNFHFLKLFWSFNKLGFFQASVLWERWRVDPRQGNGVFPGGQWQNQDECWPPPAVLLGHSHVKIVSIVGTSHLGSGFNYFLFSALCEEDVQFDEHIFQMGWFNHQLAIPPGHHMQIGEEHGVEQFGQKFSNYPGDRNQVPWLVVYPYHPIIDTFGIGASRVNIPTCFIDSAELEDDSNPELYNSLHPDLQQVWGDLIIIYHTKKPIRVKAAKHFADRLNTNSPYFRGLRQRNANTPIPTTPESVITQCREFLAHCREVFLGRHRPNDPTKFHTWVIKTILTRPMPQVDAALGGQGVGNVQPQGPCNGKSSKWGTVQHLKGSKYGWRLFHRRCAPSRTRVAPARPAESLTRVLMEGNHERVHAVTLKAVAVTL